jgi:hypothetical protein
MPWPPPPLHNSPLFHLLLLSLSNISRLLPAPPLALLFGVHESLQKVATGLQCRHGQQESFFVRLTLQHVRPQVGTGHVFIFGGQALGNDLLLLLWMRQGFFPHGIQQGRHPPGSFFGTIWNVRPDFVQLMVFDHVGRCRPFGLIDQGLPLFDQRRYRCEPLFGLFAAEQWWWQLWRRNSISKMLLLLLIFHNNRHIGHVKRIGHIHPWFSHHLKARRGRLEGGGHDAFLVVGESVGDTTTTRLNGYRTEHTRRQDVSRLWIKAHNANFRRRRRSCGCCCCCCIMVSSTTTTATATDTVAIHVKISQQLFKFGILR